MGIDKVVNKQRAAAKMAACAILSLSMISSCCGFPLVSGQDALLSEVKEKIAPLSSHSTQRLLLQRSSLYVRATD